MLIMNLHDLDVSSAQGDSYSTHLGGQGEDLAPASVRVVAGRLGELGGDDAGDTCAEHLALVVQEDAGVVVEPGDQLPTLVSAAGAAAAPEHHDSLDSPSVRTLDLLLHTDDDGAADVSAAHLLDVRGGRRDRDGLRLVHDADDLVTCGSASETSIKSCIEHGFLDWLRTRLRASLFPGVNHLSVFLQTAGALGFRSQVPGEALLSEHSTPLATSPPILPVRRDMSAPGKPCIDAQTHRQWPFRRQVVSS